MNGPMLTPTQAAARIGRASGKKPHSSTVIRWITRGVRGRKLPAICQGGQWLVSPDDADAFVRVVNAAPGSAVKHNVDAAVGAQLESLLGPKWKRLRPPDVQVIEVNVRPGEPVTVKPADRKGSAT
jgi:hypothetical protein